jgi:hypothetical protein
MERRRVKLQYARGHIMMKTTASIFSWHTALITAVVSITFLNHHPYCMFYVYIL